MGLRPGAGGFGSAALVDSLDDTATITSDQGVTHSLAIIIDN
jgi:hypothetical protein